MNAITPKRPRTALGPPRSRRRARLSGIRRQAGAYMLLACLMVGLVIPAAIARRAFGITPGSAVYLETAASIPYGGGGSTNYFWVDGRIAYCSNPQAWTPYSGWYTRSTLSVPSSNTDWTEEDIRTIMWFGYGGPGFDRTMWPQTDWDGSPITDAEYQAYTHVLLADRMWCDGGRALFGCSEAFKRWYAPTFLGYAWSGGPTPQEPDTHVAARMTARSGEVPGSDEFDVYMIDTGYNANIGTGERSQTILTYVYHPRVTVTFTKTSTAPNLTEGNAAYAYDSATYDIYTAADNKLVTSITTDGSGRAQLRLQPDTAYYAIETKAPQGFLINQERIPFNTGSETSVELPDHPASVRFTIHKTDAATGGEAQAGLSLEGAVFEVIDATGTTHQLTTNAQGLACADNLPLGTLTVREIAPPEGYRILDGELSYTVSAADVPSDGVYVLEAAEGYAEIPLAFDLDIVKYRDSGAEGSGTQSPSEGVQFQIISGTTNQVIATLTTDEAGRASTAGAWFGTGEAPERIGGALPYDRGGYIVREVASTTPAGYQPAPDWIIEPTDMVDGTTLHYIVDNDFVGSRIQIVKTDAETGETLPLAGFTFQLLDQNKQPVTQEVWYPNHQEVSSFTTDASGKVTLPQAIIPGTYYLREIATVPPYLALDEDILVSIPNDSTTPPVTVITVPNAPAKGTATITKTCATVDGNHDHPCPGALQGAEFDVVAQEDVIGPDGRILVAAGTVVDHVVTDDEGTAETTELYLGTHEATYAFVETTPPSGHVLDSTPVPFTLTYADAHTPLVRTQVASTNHPTTVDVVKTDAVTENALSQATFTLWSAADEILPVAEGGLAAIALRAKDAQTVSLERVVAHATATADIATGWTLSLEREGDLFVLGEHATTCEPGTYQLVLEQEDGTRVACTDDQITLEAGCAYALSCRGSEEGSRVEVACTNEPLGAAHTNLAYHEELDAFQATDIEPGLWSIIIDGENAATITLSAGIASTGTIDTEGLHEQTILLPEATTRSDTTDETGRVVFDHLEPGTYRIQETTAPTGYLADATIHTFTVDASGLIEGAACHSVRIANDYTKVDISKRSSTTEEVLPGAVLALIDDEGTTVASWTTESTDHCIERLEPGSYRVVELETPHGHDYAHELPIIIEATSDPQRFVLYDDPISVTGQVDKRQEIADPTRPYTSAGATEEDGGDNRAEVRVSDEGIFDYLIDMRSTSSTWVDEFTVTDTFDRNALRAATCTGITTPVTQGDFDGFYNIWYTTTGSPDDATAASSANATLGDGHDNPWLAHPATQERLGDDGRVLSYDGWHLWCEHVDASSSIDLAVADLNLAEGEQVTAIRLEYGRVDPSFTTRLDGWERDDLKAEHDDIAPEQVVEDTGSAALRPLIVHMQVTDEYAPSIPLINDARVDLFRNGGSLTEDEELEDHDEDRVVQRPVDASPSIDTALTNQADGSHSALPGTLMLVDRVTVDGLDPDHAHELIGMLKDAETGAIITDSSGKPVTVRHMLPAGNEQAVADLTYQIDARPLAGTRLVACAWIQLTDHDEDEVPQVISAHDDLADVDQTVAVQASPHRLAQTGSTSTAVLFGALSAASAVCGWMIWKRTRRGIPR